MDTDNVWSRVNQVKIEMNGGHHDFAHILEDALYRDVLSFYAYGDARRGRDLALAALKTQTIPIKRVCG